MRLRCPVCSSTFSYHPESDPVDAVFDLSIPDADAAQKADRLWLQRLAHALVSDIEVYNEARLAQARQEDRVLLEFAVEIHRAWGEFKNRAGQPDSWVREIFAAAVNEILGGGAELI
jgi:hypothetical protein